MLARFALAALLLYAAPALACSGDCDADQAVSIGELIAGVQIALDGGGLERCTAADADGDGTVSVADLIGAVTAALQGCAASCAGVVARPGAALRAEFVADGFDRPVHVAVPPADMHRLFVVEQPGTIRIVKDGVTLPEAFLDIPERVGCCGERGLLSVAFHPHYASNGRFFVDYTNNDGDTVLASYLVGADPDRADRDSEHILLTVEQPFPNHNGGQLAFGPDGYLYVGMGDGGSGGDPNEVAQDDGALLGKLLRLDVDSAAPDYAVPPTNPLAGRGKPLGLIWAKGLRNPWRFSFDRLTSDLYIGDVGQDRFEEIDVQPAASAGGENYGWDIFEGNACFEPDPFPECPQQSGEFTPPVLDYGDPGCSVTGGFVYRGCALPDWHGQYFFADFCDSSVRSFRLVDGAVTDLQDRTAALAPGGGRSIGAVTSFGEDAHGELYLVDYDGEIYRIAPAE